MREPRPPAPGPAGPGPGPAAPAPARFWLRIAALNQVPRGSTPRPAFGPEPEGNSEGTGVPGLWGGVGQD